MFGGGSKEMPNEILKAFPGFVGMQCFEVTGEANIACEGRLFYLAFVFIHCMSSAYGYCLATVINIISELTASNYLHQL